MARRLARLLGVKVEELGLEEPDPAGISQAPEGARNLDEPGTSTPAANHDGPIVEAPRP
jgi:hypothetical protein